MHGPMNVKKKRSCLGNLTAGLLQRKQFVYSRKQFQRLVTVGSVKYTCVCLCVCVYVCVCVYSHKHKHAHTRTV